MSSESGTHTYSEIDIMLRLMDPLFDMTWSWTQTFDQEKLLAKLKRRAAFEVSGSKSVSSKMSTMDASLSDMTLNEKIALLEANLKSVKKQFDDNFFDDISTAFSLSQHLYPGFKDIDFIARYLYRENDKYNKLLDNSQIEMVTLAGLMKYGLFALAKFLLEHQKGHEALKFLILPNKVTNATYDICRKRFCALVVDEVQIVQYQLTRLAKAIIKTKSKPPLELTEENINQLNIEPQPSELPDLEPQPHSEPPPRSEQQDVETQTEVDVQDVIEEECVTQDLVEEAPEIKDTEMALHEPAEEPTIPKTSKPKGKKQTDFPTPLGQIFNSMWQTSQPYWGSYPQSVVSWQPSCSDDDD